jgi:signal transduction histidine kinase
MTGRRRAALNQALHELRRPLQSLALAVGAGQATSGAESSLRLVAAALDRLDNEINGRASRRVPKPVAVRSLLESAIGRWRAGASLGGSELRLGEAAGPAVIEGDPVGLAQALDNLIVNAIEHGGSSIVVEARRYGSWLRITVADSGRGTRPESRRGPPTEVLARTGGKGRRGHGLAVVRRVAADHSGRFELRTAERGSVATLELPLPPGRAALAA